MCSLGEKVRDIRKELPAAHPRNRPADRPVGAIKRLVVHYDTVVRPGSYDPLARYISEANWHICRNWGEAGKPAVYGFGLMYHYKIDAWGGIYLCQSHERVLWHARAANYDALAVCVDLGDGQEPTAAQLEALHRWLDAMCTQHPEFPAARKDVWGHCEVPGNSTRCPGALLPYVQRYRARGQF